MFSQCRMCFDTISMKGVPGDFCSKKYFGTFAVKSIPGLYRKT